jgi:RNA polymerase sigma factor (sigma-70 family)
MTEELPGLADPVIRRLQQAFAHEEPANKLAAILHRAAHYQARAARDASDQPPPYRGLTQADLAAARQGEPAAVTRVYTAYAPTLLRFFVAAVDDRQKAQELTDGVFVSAIEALPGFRGPVEALGGWLFRIARHDLYDFRRRQARAPRLASLDDALDKPAVAPQLPDQHAGTWTTLQVLQVLLDREDVLPQSLPPQLLRWLLDIGDRSTDAPLNRLSPREKEVLALLGRGWSNAQIGRELFISPHTVRTHVQNILQKLEMHARLEAATLPTRHGWPAGAEDPEELAFEPLEGSRLLPALQRLAPDQREVLLLRMAAELTIPEVAAALGKTTGAVKALQHRGLANLARALGLRSPPSPSPDPAQPTSQEQQDA